MVRTTMFAALAVAVAFAGCTRSPGSDVTISTEVKQDLAKAQLPDTITVASNSGVVTLAGVVPDATTRQRAEVVAAHVKDVHQVLNNLQTTARAGDVPERPNVPGMPGAGPEGMPNESQNPAGSQPANPPPAQPPLNAPAPDRG